MLAARSEVLEMLEVKEDRWFGRLDDDSSKVKWMRRVYPRVDYTQASWTVAMLRQSSQSIHTSRKVDVSPAVPHSIRLFVGSSPCLVGNTAEVVSLSATTSSVCVCFLPIHSGHQVRWTYQPGSHKRKVTQDF